MNGRDFLLGRPVCGLCGLDVDDGENPISDDFRVRTVRAQGGVAHRRLCWWCSDMFYQWHAKRKWGGKMGCEVSPNDEDALLQYIVQVTEKPTRSVLTQHKNHRRRKRSGANV